MKNVYLAARYSRHPEMQGVRDVLCALVPDLTVTSRWIDQHGGTQPVSRTPEQLNTAPEECSVFAVHDMEDLQAADTVISFTFTDDKGGKGGRHVEFGMALALGKRVILVGPRENVFHTHPAVEHYYDWPCLVMALTPAGGVSH